MNWDWVVKQLQGEPLPIPKTKGRIVVNMGLGSGQQNKTRPKTGMYDTFILEVLSDVGPLSTPQLWDEMVLGGKQLTPEQLLIVCRKLEMRGLLKSSKRERQDKAGKGVVVWTLQIEAGTT
jgi:hypothetical protein